MNSINLKKVFPYIAAIVIFVSLTYGYLSPMLKGKVIYQSDMASVKGMAKEADDFRDKYEEEPLWTNSMFGGMPAYLISIRSPASLITHARTLLTLGMPSAAMLIFNYMFGFFILLLVLRVNPWLSIIGAVAFAFSSYLIIIIDAGHITKALAIGYMAPTFAGVILVCRKKFLLGGSILALFMSLELFSNHVQITYYLVMFLVIYVVIQFVDLIKEKDYGSIGKMLGAFSLAAVLAFGCNFFNLLNTYDYAQYTIRGESELTADADNKTSGLDRDYVVQWSMGKAETMSLMIPGFKGRSSGFGISENKKALKNVDRQMKSSIGGMSQYWGDQPFTSACYAGAIIIFLFVFGLFIVEGRIKWSILIAVILFSALSWGKNFMPMTNFFLDYLPGYNKFRAVSMILVMVEFSVPILAILAIDKIYKTPAIIKDTIKLKFINKDVSTQNLFFISFALTGGLSLLYFFVPTLTSFTGVADDRIFDQVAQSNNAQVAQVFMDNIEIARIALFKADALRSFVFILLGASVVWFYLKSKISNSTLLAVLGLLILADLWLLDKEYLNDDNFVTKTEAKVPFPATVADRAILTDTDPSYRVLNISLNTFNDASTSYRHKSVGGYHAAKLRRYQDMIDHHIGGEMQNLMTAMRSNPTEFSINNTFANQGVLNMMNTRYVIYNPAAAPLVNSNAFGNAWFVDEVKMVNSPDEEIDAIGNVDPSKTAVVEVRYKDEIDGLNLIEDSTASITLSEYKLNHLTYNYTTASEQLAVFSEIYYEDGWKAYVDGELTTHFGVDYILRGMRLPAGEHLLEFKFQPDSYSTRQTVTLAFSLLLFAFVGAALYLNYKNKEA